jgi:hypothetical protein
MTTMLDSVEEVLEWQGLKWERLDGTTKACARGALLRSFSTDPEVRRMLAAAVGRLADQRFENANSQKQGERNRTTNAMKFVMLTQ